MLGVQLEKKKTHRNFCRHLAYILLKGGHKIITENSQKVQTTQNVHQLMNDTKWINNHTMDDYSSMKRNGVLVHAIKWMNL